MALFIGLMSGTSMDAVDAALVELNDDSPVLRGSVGLPLPAELRRELLDLHRNRNNALEKLARLDVEMGRLFAATVHALLYKTGIDASRVTAIGSHGQTVYHQPSGPYPTSMQIGDPNLIAELTGITTIADFRRRDIGAGGQGAPLVPAFHGAVFRSAGKERVILNIGGIANITLLPADQGHAVSGFDTGPGNALMDGWALEHLGTPRDEDGHWAASGTVNNHLLTALLDDPYFSLPPPKSTGREHFNLDWLREAMGNAGMKNLPPQDVQATLCELTATSITQSISDFAPRARQILICGGGVHNKALFQRIVALNNTREIAPTTAFGIDPDWVEAMAFAWLAKRTLEGKPGNLPSVTGARREVVLGGIYPGGNQSV